IYRVTVRATNGAGLTSTATSDGVLVDATPPNVTGVPNDGAAADADLQASLATISANWAGVFADAETGIAAYQWKVHDDTAEADLFDFTTAGITGAAASNSSLSLTQGHTYRVIVQASNALDLTSTAISDGVTVEAALVLETTPAISPSGTISTDTPTFMWNAVANAHHYDVWVNTIVNGHESIGNPVLRNANVAGTSWTPSIDQALSPGQSYKWYVAAVSDTGVTFWNSGAQFTIEPLASPTPGGPSGPGASELPTFTWNSVAGANHYDVWVNVINNGQESIGSQALRNSNATGTSWTPSAGQELTPGQSYRWYVGAVSNNGTTFWDGGMTFIIDALAAPVAVGPDGSTASDTPTFT